MTALYAEILFPRKIMGPRETLTYAIPIESAAEFKRGCLVEVPLKNKSLRGIIWEIHSNPPNFATKNIHRKVDDFFHLTAIQLELLNYISSQHFCPLYKCLKLFLPGNIFNRKKPQAISQPIKHEDIIPSRFTLTEGQKKAFTQIQNSQQQIFLLHGVTGSGKTEIYRRLAEQYLQRGQQVLIMVPEISLTPQTIHNFEEQFGKNLAVIHSRLTPKSKLNYLCKIANGEHRIIIGSRSAIFSPFQNLGLIIIDEEHEDSYKQDQAPRYHARDIAIKIAEISAPNNHVKIILGSATPSLESYFAAQKKQYELVEMPLRLPQADQNDLLPKIHLIDLRDEIRKKNYTIFSDLLKDKLIETLARGEQSILFLNRRGAASAVICRDCGHTEQCPECSVSLTYHTRRRVEDMLLPSDRLVCHHCGRIFPLPTTCPDCNSHRIKYIGLGTQKIEEELAKLLPSARILRADRDTTSQKGDFENIYHTFRDGQADILIGTQMIGKGLHLPRVTLVGVMLADTTLTIPDFRSAEKTYQLLTQVAGRAGREKPGEVIIQTYQPEHFAIQSTVQHDYPGFYKQELDHRHQGLFPPFQKLIKLTIENTDQQKAWLLGQQIFQQLESHRQNHPELVSEINLFPALIAKLKNRYRWQILITGNNPHLFLQKFNLQSIFKNDIKIDVDPLHTI